MNLAVQHGPGRMLMAKCAKHANAVLGFFADHADDAAGSDIQGKQ